MGDSLISTTLPWGTLAQITLGIGADSERTLWVSCEIYGTDYVGHYD